MGESTSADMMKLEVPLNALCAWIRMVPQAAVVLLDKVLLHPPDEAPTRATIGRNVLMYTAYLDVDDWYPKTEPALLTLAPRDMGNGTAVTVKVVQQRGILNTQVFFALAAARSQIFKSLVVTAMLEHSWNYIIEIRYRMDIFCEVLTLCSLVFWTIFVEEVEPRLTGIVFVGVSVLADIMEEMRQLFFHQSKNERYLSNMFSSTGASVFRWFRILSALVLIFMVIEMEMRSNNGEVVRYEVEDYKIILSIVIFSRWCRLLSYAYGYSMIGPYVLPIVKCTSKLIYWWLVALFMFLA